MLVGGRKLLRLYSFRSDSAAIEPMLMEIGKGKLLELAD
jgi:hypothetical protein